MAATAQTLDLRGVVCPMNYVRAKLKLEQLADGEVLELILDEGEPIQNVPRSARDEGHKVELVERRGSSYLVVIRKNAGSKQGTTA